MSEATIGVLGVFILGFVAGMVFCFWMVRRKEACGKGSPPLQVPAAGFDSTSEPKSKVCADCGCLVEASKALPVVYGDYWSSTAAGNADHFCKRCKPPYDRWYWEAAPDSSGPVETFYKRVPEHETRVNKDGNE